MGVEGRGDSFWGGLDGGRDSFWGGLPGEGAVTLLCCFPGDRNLLAVGVVRGGVVRGGVVRGGVVRGRERLLQDFLTKSLCLSGVLPVVLLRLVMSLGRRGS